MMFHFIEVLYIIKGDIDSREQESQPYIVYPVFFRVSQKCCEILCNLKKNIKENNTEYDFCVFNNLWFKSVKSEKLDHGKN